MIFEGEIDGVGSYGIVPVDLGSLTVPADTPMGGRVLPVQAFLVTHPQGPVMFDTGFGSEHPDHDRSLNPVRRPVEAALAANNMSIVDVAAVVNCHLHYDHCGGNPHFPGTPIYVQSADYEAGDSLGFYVADRVTFPGGNLRVLDGPGEIMPGLRVVPTPGHTPGHQSLVIDDTRGAVVLAGQAAYTAVEFADPQKPPARGANTAWNRSKFLESIEYIHALRPRRVYFSHDVSVWERAER